MNTAGIKTYGRCVPDSASLFTLLTVPIRMMALEVSIFSAIEALDFPDKAIPIVMGIR